MVRGFHTKCAHYSTQVLWRNWHARQLISSLFGSTSQRERTKPLSFRKAVWVFQCSSQRQWGGTTWPFSHTLREDTLQENSERESTRCRWFLESLSGMRYYITQGIGRLLDRTHETGECKNLRGRTVICVTEGLPSSAWQCRLPVAHP